MPKKQLMNWDKKQPRWKLYYKGRFYQVNCRALGLPVSHWTKEASMDAANAWWGAKLLELDGPRYAPQQAAQLAELDRRISFAAAERPEELAKLRMQRQAVEGWIPEDGHLPQLDAQAIQDTLRLAEMVGLSGGRLQPDANFASQVFGDGQLWEDRLQRSKAVDAERTVGHWQQQFLAMEKTRLKPQSYKEIAEYLRKLNHADLLVPEMDVANITSNLIDRHFHWQSQQPWANAQKNKYRGFLIKFVNWLAERDVLDAIPKNLKSKSTRFKTVIKPIREFTDINQALDALPERFRLWALLGLNCGMTQADLGALDWDMIDRKAKTLTRRRVKTEANENVPVVEYKLWPETLKLLLQLPTASNNTGLVFTASNGEPLYVTRYDESGGEKKKDMFSTFWSRIGKEGHPWKNFAIPSISLGKFRSIGASQLKKRKEYRLYVDLYLGHTPKSVADKHYAAEDWKAFHEAIDFIRTQILPKKRRG